MTETTEKSGHVSSDVAGAIAGDATGFDCFARLPTRPFPGGTLLRWPGQVAGMLWYSLRDRF